MELLDCMVYTCSDLIGTASFPKWFYQLLLREYESSIVPQLYQNLVFSVFLKIYSGEYVRWLSSQLFLPQSPRLEKNFL